MLTFPIKKEWMDLITNGVKKEEYRDLTPFYIARIGKHIGEIITVKLLNGYSSVSPSITITCKVSTGTGRPEWGAVPGKYYFVLQILEILEINKGETN